MLWVMARALIVRMGGWIPIRVDFVYHTQDIETDEAQVLDVRCSDHQPIVTQLFVPNGGLSYT